MLPIKLHSPSVPLDAIIVRTIEELVLAAFVLSNMTPQATGLVHNMILSARLASSIRSINSGLELNVYLATERIHVDPANTADPFITVLARFFGPTSLTTRRKIASPVEPYAARHCRRSDRNGTKHHDHKVKSEDASRSKHLTEVSMAFITGLSPSLSFLSPLGLCSI